MTETEYRADYRKGWRYAHRETASLDNTGGKSEAWHDGYSDYAQGLPMWAALKDRAAQ